MGPPREARKAPWRRPLRFYFGRGRNGYQGGLGPVHQGTSNFPARRPQRRQSHGCPTWGGPTVKRCSPEKHSLVVSDFLSFRFMRPPAASLLPLHHPVPVGEAGVGNTEASRAPLPEDLDCSLAAHDGTGEEDPPPRLLDPHSQPGGPGVRVLRFVGPRLGLELRDVDVGEPTHAAVAGRCSISSAGSTEEQEPSSSFRRLRAPVGA
jgi:hypothetical protein